MPCVTRRNFLHMKKKIAITVAVTLLALLPYSHAQERIGAGGLMSAAYYMGDFNIDQPLYMPSLYVAGVISYNLSDFYDLHINMGGGQLRGNPAKFDGRLLSNTPNQQPSAFKRNFFDADVRLDVGFLPYDAFGIDKHKFSYTPYVSLGAGLCYSSGQPYFQLPFSFGVKYRLMYRLTMGAEWAFRKTFNDNIDGWENIRTTSPKTLHNNDWISYIGIYFTYQLSDKVLCPSLM